MENSELIFCLWGSLTRLSFQLYTRAFLHIVLHRNSSAVAGNRTRAHLRSAAQRDIRQASATGAFPITNPRKWIQDTIYARPRNITETLGISASEKRKRFRHCRQYRVLHACTISFVTAQTRHLAQSTRASAPASDALRHDSWRAII